MVNPETVENIHCIVNPETVENIQHTVKFEIAQQYNASPG